MKRIIRLFRSSLPMSLRLFIQRVGTFFGPKPTPEIEAALRRLHSLGFDPRFCVDVGAYRGDWAQMCKAVFAQSKILMIEAQAAKHATLEGIVARHPGEFSLEMSLLGATDGQTVTFSEMETGSSVFAENSPYARNVVEKATFRLDTLLTRGSYPTPDFLKLDVQGYELEVLKGASEALRQTTAVLLEASLIPINAGCPLLAEVVNFMTAAGFRLFDICGRSRRRDGALWQTDLIFLREDAKILPQAALTAATWV